MTASPVWAKTGALCLLALISTFAAPASAADAAPKVVIKADKRTGKLVRTTINTTALPSITVPSTSSARKVMIKADAKTGKLVRVTVAAPKITIIPPSPDIAAMVHEASLRNNIDPLLVRSVIQVESAYNPYAISTAGARGLMQLMPGTARELGVTNSFDPRQNIEAGVKYLKYLKDLYQDDRLALAAYNAGPGAVQKYKEVPPYPETQDYVQRVGERYEAWKATTLAPVAAQPEPQQ